MDRLEKALDKARKLREVKLPFTSGPHNMAPGAAAQSALHSLSANSVITDEAQLERRRILAHRTRSAEADIFRILRTQVLQVMSKSGFRALAITSPNYGDGKTTVSLNLAVSIALDLKQTVLLVDLDLRKPNLHEFLGLEPGAGLSDYLLHDKPLSSCIQRLSFDRLSILPAGKPLENSSEVLGSPKMAALAHDLKTRYPDRIVIYDMPPVLSQDDSIAFLPHVDAVLMVIRDAVTLTAEVKRCLDALSDSNVIGTVLNNSRHG
ncbi:MAG: CpsD/CapB family tyrosine-protein kinase [Pseudomonadota bacterium]|nr:CpsD/CapB family tyrosine-protein kinase [Pseudomonadota bacterium]